MWRVFSRPKRIHSLSKRLSHGVCSVVIVTLLLLLIILLFLLLKRRRRMRGETVRYVWWAEPYVGGGLLHCIRVTSKWSAARTLHIDR